MNYEAYPILSYPIQIIYLTNNQKQLKEFRVELSRVESCCVWSGSGSVCHDVALCIITVSVRLEAQYSTAEQKKERAPNCTWEDGTNEQNYDCARREESR